MWLGALERCAGGAAVCARRERIGAARGEAARRHHVADPRRSRDDRVAAVVGLPAARTPSEDAAAADRGARQRRRRRIPDGDDPRGAASPAGVPVRDSARRQAADRDRRLHLRAAGASAGVHLSPAPRSAGLPRAGRVPAGALSRGSAGSARMDAVGRGPQALSGPAHGDARDEDGAASGAGKRRRVPREPPHRASALAQCDRDAARRRARRAAPARSRSRDIARAPPYPPAVEARKQRCRKLESDPISK